MKREQFSSWSFKLFIASVILWVIGASISIGGSAVLRSISNICINFSLLMFLASYIACRLANSEKNSSVKLSGWEYKRSLFSAVIFSAHLLLIIVILLPVGAFFLFEDNYLDKGAILFGKKYLGTDIMMIISGTVFVFTLISLFFLFAAHLFPNVLRSVFFPLFNNERFGKKRIYAISSLAGLLISIVFFVLYIILRPVLLFR
ncbi:MAG: hypothetical protein GY754_39300 [bacterium]|nr:hypothetical protein [bacterium]